MENIFKSQKKHFYKKNFLIDTPNWQYFIDNLDFSIKNNLSLQFFDNCGIVLHDLKNVKNVKDIKKNIIKSNDTKYNCSSHAYISFSSKSKTFGKHKDTSDVWFWQCIGETMWKIYDDSTHEYILKSGDLIYIPHGMYHHTTPISPRVGISFGLDYPPPIEYS
jgi:hypothetical protein